MPKVAHAAMKAKSAKSCILLWMPGGPSQYETLDPKPGRENGGPTKAIATSVSGIEISENLPKLARCMNDISIIRSMSTIEGDHDRASRFMQTGYRPLGAPVEYPVLGSLVAHRLHSDEAELPGFISIAGFRSADFGAGYLGPKYSPLNVSGSRNDPNSRANPTVENLTPLGGDVKKIAAGSDLFGALRASSAGSSSSAMKKHEEVYNQAMRMMETQGGGAFKLDEEPDVLRDAYGRNRFGQGCLLARRLVERGVPFVEVALSDDGTGGFWDSHQDNFNVVSKMCGVLDPAWSTLITDLRDRALLDSTLVIWMGEFGRTPKINATVGRDHYPDGWSVALGGAGIQTGRVIGSTGKDGTETIDGVTTTELFATIFQALDIDPTSSNQSGDRPLPIVDEYAKPLKDLVG